MRTRLVLGASTLLALTISLAGCSEGISDLERFVAETKQKYPGEVEPLPEIEPYRSFTYDASILEDPFTVVEQIIAEIPSGPKPDSGRRKEPLEFFPLNALTMMGTLEQNNAIWGLVQDSDGTIHRVQTGNYIGESDGRITSVNETKISISELIPDGRGAWINRQVSLTLGGK